MAMTLHHSLRIESLVLPGFEVMPAIEHTAPEKKAGGGAVFLYYVTVKLVGSDGSTRRGNIAVDGDQLRALTRHLGDARAARNWVRGTVSRLCRVYPQDLSLGSARWKPATGETLPELVGRAMTDLTGVRAAPRPVVPLALANAPADPLLSGAPCRLAAA